MSKIKKKRSSKIIRITIRQHHITSAKSKNAYSVQKSVFQQSLSENSSETPVKRHSEIQSVYSSSKNQVIVFISS